MTKNTETPTEEKKIKIEIIYNPDGEKYKQTIKITSKEGNSIIVPTKVSGTPEEVINKIKEILVIDDIEFDVIPTIKEVPVTKDNPYDWTKITQPYNPTYPSPVTVPYKNPEIWCDVNKGQYCVECSDKTTV